jgi:hypothetical protein
MKEHPILFSGPMVRAILEGRKTQTRRVMKPQPDESKMRWTGSHWEMYLGYPIGHDVPISPYGQTGDLLWVREMAKLRACGPGSCEFDLAYPADESVKAFCDTDYGPYKMTSYTPSIHMPRWASRLILRITDVRVQRLQDITEADAKAEGLDEWIPCVVWTGLAGIKIRDASRNATCREHFIFAWSSINAKRGYSWESNPWVWAITFEVIK